MQVVAAVRSGAPGEAHVALHRVRHPRLLVRRHQLIRARRQRVPHRGAHLLPPVLVYGVAGHWLPAPPGRRRGRCGRHGGVGAPEGGAEGGVLPGEAVGEGIGRVRAGAEGGDEAPEGGEGSVVVCGLRLCARDVNRDSMSAGW